MDTRFTVRQPPVSSQLAEQLALSLFGKSVRALPLGSERDHNFHLSADDGSEYVLKISNPAENPMITAYQTACLRHIAAHSRDLPIPHVVQTVDGRSEAVSLWSDQTLRTVRMLTYLPGEPLYRSRGGREQRRRIGATLAALDRALGLFPEKPPCFELPWDMTQASQIKPLLEHIANPDQRAIAVHCLDNYEKHALPAQPYLRTQVIHNDLNPHNLLVDPSDPDRITGIIDFGDITFAPTIYDVAVAASYQILEGDHPLGSAAEFIAGYHAENPLEDREIDLLLDLIRTRLTLTVAITGWRAAKHPENSTYILRNNPGSWRALEQLASFSRAEAHAFLHQICTGA